MGKAMAAIIWTTVVIILSIVLFLGTMSNQYYHSERISFEGVEYEHGIELEIDSGWYISFEPFKVVRVVSAHSQYFCLYEGLDTLYAIPEDSPLGYPWNDYYRLEAEEIEGALGIKKGKEIDTVLISEESFSITYSPTQEEFDSAAYLTSFVAIVICVIGIAIVAVHDYL